MKIIYLYKDYFPVLGGIENHTRQLAEGMAARGHEVEVLVTNTGRTTTRSTLAGVSILKAGRWVNVTSAPLSPRLAFEYLRRYRQADIVHLQFPYPPGELAWLLGSYGPGRKPHTVLSYQSDIVRQKKLLKVYLPFLKKVLQRVDLILPSSPNYIQSSDFLRPLAGKCRVVPLGIEYERFANAQPEAALAHQRGPLLLFAGRLRYYKGLQYLVEALPQVQPNAHLIIVGIGPMEASLKEQVARLGLSERVTFAGEVSDENLPGYYAASDIFILPACERSEAYGLVQLEAMAAAKPVVSTELGTGTSYVNQNEVTGLVVPPADPTALATAINRLLANEPERLEMGRQAQKRVQTEFNLELMYGRVEKIYIELSGEGGGSS